MIREHELTGQHETGPSPERIIDITEKHPLEKMYEQQFPDDIELQSLHLEMSLGIAARECRVAYAIKQTTGWLHGNDSQEDYLFLMRNMSEQGTYLEDNYSSKTLPLQRMFNTLNSMHDFLSPSQFKHYIDRQLDKHQKFMTEPGTLTTKELMKLRSLAHAVRTASELQMADYLAGYEWPDHDEGEQHSRLAMLDGRLIREFSDAYYWRNGGGFSFLTDGERLQLTSVTKNMIEIYARTEEE